jgi:hypothetical protein
MVVGSFASTAHGEPRTTRDLDLVIRKARPFSTEELRRRTITKILGMDVPTATAKDTIIAKLEWAKLGASDRQLEDVAGIRRARGPDLDVDYRSPGGALAAVCDDVRNSDSPSLHSMTPASFDVPAHSACACPGYAPRRDGYSEQFAQRTLAEAGWSIAGRLNG